MARWPMMVATAAVPWLGLAAGPARAAEMSERYVGGLPAGGPVVLFPWCVPDPSVGGVCVDVPTGASTVDIHVSDGSGAVVAADVFFVVGYSDPVVVTRRFCGSTDTVPVPPGAAGTTVRILTAESVSCPGGGVPTAGTVAFAFD